MYEGYIARRWVSNLVLSSAISVLSDHRYRAQEGWVTVARRPRRREHPSLLWQLNKRLWQGSPPSAPLTTLGDDSETKRFL